MHSDHRLWRSEGELWLDEITLWQKEIADAQRQLRRAELVIRRHSDSLRKHDKLVRARTKALARHEQALASYERGNGNGLELDLLQMAKSHRRQAGRHAREREMHESLKKRHYKLTADMTVLSDALAGLGSREPLGSSPSEFLNEDSGHRPTKGP
jgi:hypothetical protein